MSAAKIAGQVVPPVAAAGAGAAAGGAVVAASGMTAVGAVGGGAGMGAAAGPVGMVFGGIAGLALYGLYRVCNDVAHQVVGDLTSLQRFCPQCCDVVHMVKIEGKLIWLDTKNQMFCSETGKAHDAQPIDDDTDNDD